MSIWRSAPPSDKRLFFVSVFCLVGSLTALNLRESNVRAAGGDEEFYRFTDVAAQVYSEIRSKYVEEVDDKEILEAALRGMTSILDEHSQYMPPTVLEDLEKETGKEYGGLGIHITVRQGILTVIAPMPGGPAARAGLQPWDRIVEIEGETTEKMEMRDAVDKLMGPPNTKVKFKVWREGLTEPVEYELARQNIRIESVSHKMMDNNVGYIRLSRFSENSTTDMRKAINELKTQGMKSIILDLRFNTGGLLREAIDISDLFLPKGAPIVATKGRLRNQNREERSQNDPIVKVPVFVLVNGGSASASEILAGALQDNHVALVIGPAGQNTYGKGSVQTIENLTSSLQDDKNGNPRTSALRLTTARYYTPSGRTIHRLGVTPDIGVPIPRGHESEVLERGLLGDPPNPRAFEEDTNADAPVDDNAPFYTKARKPGFKNDDYKDIILNEALQEMRLYMEMLPEMNGTSDTRNLAAVKMVELETKQ